MVGESWDVFTKRVLIEKNINGIMDENSGSHGPLALPPPLPIADAYKSSNFSCRSNV